MKRSKLIEALNKSVWYNKDGTVSKKYDPEITVRAIDDYGNYVEAPVGMEFDLGDGSITLYGVLPEDNDE